MLAKLYMESPLVFLEKLLESTNYGESLMVLVFHLSHLLLRMLFFGDTERNVQVFSTLFNYQTQKLIQKCAHLMDFEDWLGYIKAM